MYGVVSRRVFFVAALGGVSLRLPGANEYFEKVTYFQKKPHSDKPNALGGKLMLDRDAKRIVYFSENTKRLELPLDRISNLVYERTKRPRYAMGLLIAWPLFFTKTKKHFLTIQYKDSDGEGQYALFQLDKGNYRDVLAGLEAASGQRVERLEEK